MPILVILLLTLGQKAALANTFDDFEKDLAIYLEFVMVDADHDFNYDSPKFQEHEEQAFQQMLKSIDKALASPDVPSESVRAGIDSRFDTLLKRYFIIEVKNGKHRALISAKKDAFDKHVAGLKGFQNNTEAVLKLDQQMRQTVECPGMVPTPVRISSVCGTEFGLEDNFAFSNFIDYDQRGHCAGYSKAVLFFYNNFSFDPKAKTCTIKTVSDCGLLFSYGNLIKDPAQTMLRKYLRWDSKTCRYIIPCFQNLRDLSLRCAQNDVQLSYQCFEPFVREFHDNMRGSKYEPSSAKDLLAILFALGGSGKSKGDVIAKIKSAKRPVELDVEVLGPDAGYHAVLAIGYDEKRQTILVSDSNFPDQITELKESMISPHSSTSVFSYWVQGSKGEKKYKEKWRIMGYDLTSPKVIQDPGFYHRVFQNPCDTSRK